MTINCDFCEKPKVIPDNEYKATIKRTWGKKNWYHKECVGKANAKKWKNWSI